MGAYTFLWDSRAESGLLLTCVELSPAPQQAAQELGIAGSSEQPSAQLT